MLLTVAIGSYEIVTCVLLTNILPYQLSIIIISINYSRKETTKKEKTGVHFLISSFYRFVLSKESI